MRIPLATTLKSRDGTLDQDAKVLNGVVEPDGDAAPKVRRRPGLTDLGLVRAGAAQLLYYWYNKVRTVIGDYIGYTNAPSELVQTTWNSADKDADVALSNGDLTITVSAGGFARSVLPCTSGSWAWQVTVATATGAVCVGMANSSATFVQLGASNDSIAYSSSSGQISKNSAVLATVATYTVGDVIKVVYDFDATTIAFYKNGTLVYTATGSNVPSGTLYAAAGANSAGAVVHTANFDATSTAANLSPTSAGELFSAQDNGANSPNALLMIKNSSQAWTINTSDTVTQITDTDYPGKYTVELDSLTRTTTVATATAKTSNNFIAGESVTIANVSNGTHWNATFTIASVSPLDITEPLAARRITITRSSTTATAQTYDGTAHNLETGDSVILAGALQDEYNGTFTITVTSPTTFTFTVSTSTETTGAFTNLGVTSLTRSGTLAKAVCASPHGITSTATVTVAGADQSAYNGSYTVTKLTATDFTYAITVTGAGFTTTGAVGPVTVTLSYDATTGRVTGTSAGAHGLANNSSITVTGATPNSFNGVQGPITVTSTTTFYYRLAAYYPESAAAGSNWPISTPANNTAYVFSRNARAAATSVAIDAFGAGVLTVTMSPPAWATAGTMCGVWVGEDFYWGLIYSVSAGSFTVDIGHLGSGYGLALGYVYQGGYVVEGYALTSVAQTAGAATATTSEAHGYTTGHLVIIAPYPWTVEAGSLTSGWYSTAASASGGLPPWFRPSEQAVTSGGASAIGWTMRHYYAGSPAATAVTGTITLASGGVQVYQPGTPAEIATGTITATSAGTAVTTPATPATGTIEVTRPGTVNASSFTFTVENDNTKYTTPATTASTITAFSGKTTVPGIAYLNGYFVVMDQAGVLYNSAIDDPSTWEALEYTSALNEPGAGVAVVKTGGYVAAMKEWSTEFFYDAANPTGSPLSPVENGFTLVGCAQGWSVANVDGSTMWISQSKKHKGRKIHRMVGTEQAPVSTPDVERVLNADSLASVRAWGVSIDGHPCYVLSLIASDITLVYDTISQVWSQWSSYTISASKSITSITRSGTTATVTFGAAHGLSDGDPLTIAGATQTDYNGLFQVKYVSTTVVTIEVENSPVTPATGTILGYPYTESYFKLTHYTAADGVDVVLHVSDGHLYELDPAEGLDDGVPVNYFVRTSRLDGGATGLKKVGSVRVIGDKVSDTAMVRWSDDDSASFTKYRDVNLALKEPELRRCGSFRRRSFEVRHVTDALPRLSELEIEVGGQ